MSDHYDAHGVPLTCAGAEQDLACLRIDLAQAESSLADANTMIGSLSSQLAKAQAGVTTWKTRIVNEGEQFRAALAALRAELASAQEHHRLTVTGVWDDSVAPGGYVCGYCGTPVESEPCADHEAAPSTEEPDATLTAVERWRTDSSCDPTGMTATGGASC